MIERADTALRCMRLLSIPFALALCVPCGLGCGDDGSALGDSVDDGGGSRQPDGGGASRDAATPAESPDAGMGAASADAASEDAAIPEPTGDPLIVAIDDGMLKGEWVGETRRFLKIPFAKPPVGPLRWQAPVDNEAWSGVREETEFSEPCAQGASQGSTASANEDCLYLNVWTPDPATVSEPSPVMVWIHGGANRFGAASDIVPTTQQLWFDGQYFAARHGIVLVTTNYRLGPLGFFAHPALAEEGSPLGNQGLLDQVAALRWVRDNIEAFGGDPGNVTIFGESAGASDVCYHVASPLSRGLFHRAISQSGGCTLPGGLGGGSAQDAAEAHELVADLLDCGGADDVMACMRQAPVGDVLSAAGQAADMQPPLLHGEATPFGVVIDGEGGFLPEAPAELFERGEVAQVPYILGSNTDEGALFVFGTTLPTTEEEYLDALESRYGQDADRIAAQYPIADFDGDAGAALTRVVGDQIIACSSQDSARHAARAGLPVYAYNFNVVWALLPTLNVSHASEISHVFGNPVNVDAESQAVSDAMNAYWAQFAATGDPNHADAPATWPPYGPDPDESDMRLQLDPDWAVLEDFRVAECAMWSELARD